MRTGWSRTPRARAAAPSLEAQSTGPVDWDHLRSEQGSEDSGRAQSSPQAGPPLTVFQPNVQQGTVLASLPQGGRAPAHRAAHARPLPGSARLRALKVGTQGAPHFPGCPRPKPLIPGTPKDGGRGGPTPPGRIGQSQRLLSGHAWPGAWGSRALRLKPGLATDQPGLRTSRTTSEKSVAGRRQRVGERRGPRGGRVLKTLAPDTGSPISRQRGDAPRGGRTPPHPRSEAECQGGRPAASPSGLRAPACPAPATRRLLGAAVRSPRQGRARRQPTDYKDRQAVRAGRRRPQGPTGRAAPAARAPPFVLAATPALRPCRPRPRLPTPPCSLCQPAATYVYGEALGVL